MDMSVCKFHVEQIVQIHRLTPSFLDADERKNLVKNLSASKH